MTKAMAVPVELDLLQDLMALIDHNIKFESHPANRLRALLAVPVVGEPERYLNTGHGHVRPRPDGVKMRCGGPAACKVCAREAAIEALTKND